MMQIIRKEISSYKKANHYPKEVSKKNLIAFSWAYLIEDMKENMPTLYSACVAAIATKRKQDMIE